MPKQKMGSYHMKVFGKLHVVHREMQDNVREASASPRAKPQKGDRENFHPAGRTECLDNIGGIPAAGENHQNIPGLGEGTQLQGKGLGVARIIPQASQHRRIGRKGMSTEEGLAAGSNPVNQIRRQVVGIGRTAAISAKEKISPTTPTSLQGGSSPREGSCG
jgi:hypothetical protein